MKNSNLNQFIEVPMEIKNLQEWFASIITRPLIAQGCINPIAPNGNLIEKEAVNFIVSNSAIGLISSNSSLSRLFLIATFCLSFMLFSRSRQFHFIQ